MASGFPPIAGIVTAIVGGLLATFFGGAHLTIKGPAAGLIVIVLGAVSELGGGVVGYRRALATIVVAGVLQLALARMRAGVLGDTFPSSVIHGMMAAVGVIIVSKQSYQVLGVPAPQGGPMALLAHLPASVLRLNPQVAVIGLLCLAVLVLLPRLTWRWSKQLPPSLAAIAIGIGLGFFFDLRHPHHYMIGGHDFAAGPGSLLPLDARLWSSLAFPDWSAITSGVSIKYVVMFALVGSIESLLSAKAVDGLDPWQRRASLDRDLFAVGIGNIVAATLGGLPMISEIVRSSANVRAGAKTKWANFFHGLLLLTMVSTAPWLLRTIPTAALAAVLVFTGVRLASPSEFSKTWRIGPEQAVIFMVTMVATLATDLLVGVILGILCKFALHLMGGMPIRNSFAPSIRLERVNRSLTLHIGHAAVFSNYLTIQRVLSRLRVAQTVRVDFSQAHIVDHTVLEGLERLSKDWEKTGRSLSIVGLEGHKRTSAHPYSMARRSVVREPSTASTPAD